MSKYRAKIKVYSDIEDISSIQSAIKQIELKSLPVIPIYTKRFSVEPNVILILQVKDIESQLLSKIIKVKNSIRNKVIFVVPNSNALLVSSIAKLGFVDIFIFPYELYKFISYLEEIVTNNAFITWVPASEDFAENIDDFRSIIGNSKDFVKTISLAKKVAAKEDINILIRGETGTGKGLLARAIHNFGNTDSSRPFVDIVCSSIPENLLESELFGYEPGAFTNAKARKLGLFELAENGTLFLDEIGDLSINIQKKLLRAIEKKVIRHLGGINDIPINTRIISATNMDLEKLIREDAFRNDLYYRLNVVTLTLSPVRERPDDILLFSEHFIKQFNQQFGKSIKRIDNETKDFLVKYPWPGNVREIRNAMERAVLLANDTVLRLSDMSTLVNAVPPQVPEGKEALNNYPQYINMNLNYTITSIKILNELYAKQVIEKTKGNKSKAAKLLKISRPKLDLLIK